MDYTPIKIEKASPITVSMRQARLALHQLGVLDQVEAAINALDEPDRTVASIEWNYASIIERDNPLVNEISAALGLDCDDLFSLAKGL